MESLNLCRSYRTWSIGGQQTLEECVLMRNLGSGSSFPWVLSVSLRTPWKKCCFSGDGEYIVAGSARQHALYIWEKSIGNLVKILHGTRGELLLDVAVSRRRGCCCYFCNRRVASFLDLIVLSFVKFSGILFDPSQHLFLVEWYPSGHRIKQ